MTIGISLGAAAKEDEKRRKSATPTTRRGSGMIATATTKPKKPRSPRVTSNRNKATVSAAHKKMKGVLGKRNLTSVMKTKRGKK